MGTRVGIEARSFECYFLGSGDFEVPIGFNTLGNHMETSCLYPVSVVSKVIVRDLGVLTSIWKNYLTLTIRLCYFVTFFSFFFFIQLHIWLDICRLN